MNIHCLFMIFYFNRQIFVVKSSCQMCAMKAGWHFACNALYTSTAMVAWQLRNIFRQDKMRAHIEMYSNRDTETSGGKYISMYVRASYLRVAFHQRCCVHFYKHNARQSTEKRNTLQLNFTHSKKPQLIFFPCWKGNCLRSGYYTNQYCLQNPFLCPRNNVPEVYILRPFTCAAQVCITSLLEPALHHK